jgi:hypothetical protein
MLYSEVYKSMMCDRVMKSLEEGKTRIDTSQGSGAQSLTRVEFVLA